MHKITLQNPKASSLANFARIYSAFNRVVDSGSYILGNEVATFENAFAKHVEQPYAVGCANGTDAITLALKSLGVELGAYVLVPSLTAVATVVGIERAGAVPVFVDVDDSMTVDPARVEQMMRTLPISAVVAVNLYGAMCQTEALRKLCDKYGAWLIVDSAQTCIPTLHADAVTYSFYPTKPLGAIGDGGAVCFDLSTHSFSCRMLREYGWINRDVKVRGGMNSRLDELQAAILSAKLPGIAAEHARRRETAWQYGRCDKNHTYHLFVARFIGRTAAQVHLRSIGIHTAIHYTPVHQQAPYASYKRGELPVTNDLANQILSLPCHAYLTDEEVQWVKSALSQIS